MATTELQCLYQVYYNLCLDVQTYINNLRHNVVYGEVFVSITLIY